MKDLFIPTMFTMNFLVMPNINETIFYRINGLAGQNNFLDTFFISITSYEAMLIIFLVAIFFVFWDRRKTFVQKLENKRVYYVLLSVITTMIIVYFLKIFFKIPRPFEILENMKQLIPETKGVSFPSGHAAFIMSLATSVYLIHPQYRKMFFVKILFVIAFLVIYSRVFVGVHFPLDVVVGAFLGTLTSFIFFNIFRKYLD